MALSTGLPNPHPLLREKFLQYPNALTLKFIKEMNFPNLIISPCFFVTISPSLHSLLNFLQVDRAVRKPITLTSYCSRNRYCSSKMFVHLLQNGKIINTRIIGVLHFLNCDLLWAVAASGCYVKSSWRHVLQDIVRHYPSAFAGDSCRSC